MKQTAWILVFLSASVLSAQADEVEQRRIEVVGKATIAREPDRARISFAVETQAKTAKEAADLNAAQTTKLLAALKAKGIQKSDLQTRHYRLSPRYRTDEQGRLTLDPEGHRIRASQGGFVADNTVEVVEKRLDQIGALIDTAIKAGAYRIGSVNFELSEGGFIVDNTVEVLEKRLDQIGALVDTAIEAGANQIGDISFELSQPQSARREALAAAVKAAKLDADVIAHASGQKLGQIIEMWSTIEPTGPAVEGWWTATSRPEAGTMLVTARVTVRFQLQD